MARYYGSAQGGRTEVHRLGHATTGIRTLCATWGAGIEVTMNPDRANGGHGEDIGDWVTIALVPHGYSDLIRRVLYTGPLQALIDHLNANNSGKVLALPDPA